MLRALASPRPASIACSAPNDSRSSCVHSSAAEQEVSSTGAARPRANPAVVSNSSRFAHENGPGSPGSRVGRPALRRMIETGSEKKRLCSRPAEHEGRIPAARAQHGTLHLGERPVLVGQVHQTEAADRSVVGTGLDPQRLSVQHPGRKGDAGRPGGGRRLVEDVRRDVGREPVAPRRAAAMDWPPDPAAMSMTRVRARRVRGRASGRSQARATGRTPGPTGATPEPRPATGRGSSPCRPSVERGGRHPRLPRSSRRRSSSVTFSASSG